MIEILGLDSLFAEMVTGLGLALLVGNLLAWRKHRRGETPAGLSGEFRTGRVRFLLAVGILMTIWGVGSLLSGTDSSTAMGLGHLW